MDDDRLDDSHATAPPPPYPRPSETLRSRESQAKEIVEQGLRSLQQLQALVQRLSAALLEFSGNLKTISAEEQQRSGAVVREQAPGASELWNVLQSFTVMLSVSNEATAGELISDFAKPLEEMQASLGDLRKALDLQKRKRKLDPLAMENHIDKEKKTCLKALKSLQGSVRDLVESSHVSGILSKMTRRRYEKTVKKKILQVKELFRRYEDVVGGYNRQLEAYETTVQLPLLDAIKAKDSQRLELLKQCTMNLEVYLSAITSPEQATSIVMRHALHSINEARRMSTASSLQSQPKLQFFYDLPCAPDAFDRQTWPGSSGLVWYTGSFQEPSTRKDSVGRRDTAPEIRPNASHIWAISHSGDSDQELQDSLKIIEEDNVEPKPEAATFSFVKPKVVSARHEGEAFPGRLLAGPPSGPGFPGLSKGPEPINKLFGVFGNLSRPLAGGGSGSYVQVVDAHRSQQQGEYAAAADLAHPTLNRPALRRPRQRRPART